MIHAPYNFVPLSNKSPYTPDWLDCVSHDIPFSDGESGTLHLRITAHTPIYVRNGASKEQGTDSTFSNVDGRFFIPGTSIKGAIRNVLEIISFGNMVCPSAADNSNAAGRRVNDHRHAYRDLTPAGKATYLAKMKSTKIRCGWLHKTDVGDHAIEDWGIPARISHQDLDSAYATSLAKACSEKMGNDATKKTARYKYETLAPALLLHTDKFAIEYGNLFNIAKQSLSGKEGTIVLTGQPGPRDNETKKGKKWEFVFLKPDAATLRTHTIDKHQWEDFRSIYNDHDDNKVSADWKFWRDQMEKDKRAPVFFLLNDNGSIEHFGLAYLYKMPTTHSVRDGIPLSHLSTRDGDLADCIFGSIVDVKNERYPLRGRVHFGHAWATTATADAEKQEVLGSPKSSYYPQYIKQHSQTGNTSSFTNYMSDQITLSGWKRYPVHSGLPNKTSQRKPGENENMVTKFTPVREGAVFCCPIRLHNLRSIEIGALLSALLFHEHPGCLHRLGMAKPLGYGNVKIEITKSEGFAADLSLAENRKRYLKSFELELNKQLFANRHEWHTSEQLCELISMALPPQSQANPDFSYMTLEEHVAAKNNGVCRQSYSQISGAQHPVIESMWSQAELAELIAQEIQAEETEKQRIIEEEKQGLLEIQKAQELAREQQRASMSEKGFDNVDKKLVRKVIDRALSLQTQSALTPELQSEFQQILLNIRNSKISNATKKHLKNGKTWTDIEKVLGKETTKQTQQALHQSVK